MAMAISRAVYTKDIRWEGKFKGRQSRFRSACENLNIRSRILGCRRTSAGTHETAKTRTCGRAPARPASREQLGRGIHQSSSLADGGRGSGRARDIKRVVRERLFLSHR